MSLESFYGGRQGASFVIVERFDGEDIPVNSKYKQVYYAEDSSGVLLYPFVMQNGNNFNNYSWQLVTLNGATVNVVETGGVHSTQVLSVVYQKGMRQCFEQGGDTVDIVNYGEYVIIDTISKDNPENGRVYRRGMNFDYDPVSNPLAGAEYIGQIVGPSGATVDLDMKPISEFIEPYRTGLYDFSNQGLVPGTNTGRTSFESGIRYAWTAFKDAAGNIISYLIGFTFPYLVADISGSWRKPYYTQEDYNLGRITDPSLIGTKIRYEDDFELFIDNGWNSADRDPTHGDTGHPFYRKWKVSVPKGIKGDSQEDLEIYPTKVTDGAVVYNVVNSSGVLSDPKADPAYNLSLVLDNYETTKNIGRGYCAVDGGGYVYLSDTTGRRMRYKEVVYDNLEAGESHFVDIGDYNTIERVQLSEDGWLTVFYSWKDPQTVEEVIRWIKYDSGEADPKGIQFDEDGSITITYNTLDAEGHNEQQVYEDLLSWVTRVSLSEDGNFKIIFNNDTNRAAIEAAEPGSWRVWGNEQGYFKHLQWIRYVDLDEDGTIKFYYNDDPQKQYPIILQNKIKWIENVYIDTDGNNPPAGYQTEGVGSQKVHVVYNTKTDGINNDEEIIGRPINYIIESLVSQYNYIDNVDADHLLVYYSDPDYRAWLAQNYPNRMKRYQGTKDTAPKDGWFDLGYVKGEPGGIHIIGNVADPSALVGLKPEDIMHDPKQAGWAMTVGNPNAEYEIYVYDYARQVWYSIGTVNSNSVDPRWVIDQNDEVDGLPIKLKDFGYWMVTDKRKFAV